MLFFQADYDEIELQKISYDVILVTSWLRALAEKFPEGRGQRKKIEK